MLNSRIVLVLLSGWLSVADAAEWPTYRGDAARSGFTADKLPRQLSLVWSYHPVSPPSPAWGRDDRMLFDRANEVVVTNGLVIFGSSADCRVVALDASTGELRWTYFTDAPVRFAPAVWRDRVFVVSDDGCLYCLSTSDGALQNRWQGGPGDELILGNGRMISRWPARGGPVIHDDVVYFAAGIWQSEGVFLYAIDAATGRQLWRNEDAARIYMAQPHGGAMAESGVSAQGYLVATDDHLLIPTGRAVPAAFARHDGKFLYYHLQANGHIGGTLSIAAGTNFYNGGSAFDIASGSLEAKLGTGSLAALDDGVLHANKKKLRLLKIVEGTAPDRKGNPVKTRQHEEVWSLDDIDGSSAMIVAGDTIVAAGGDSVTLVDAKTQKVNWSTKVDGTPFGLAAADGRLYVSTDQGTIYCFDGSSHPTPKAIRQIVRVPENVDPVFGKAADEIIRLTGIKDGYCLDLNCGRGELALALAQRTNLHIYALAASAPEVAAARQMLSDAGVYGTRVTVHQGDASRFRYGKYFADLIVSSESLKLGALNMTAESPHMALRPSGGIACTGRPGAMHVVARPELARTGEWTHQYADLGNTSCSADELVKGQLHALWFRDVDLDMPQRHGRGPAPLFHGGRMFVEGLNALRAVDAYNGRNLWEFALPKVLTAYNADHLAGSAVTGSNFCVSSNDVFVHDKQRCYRLDAATGKKLGEFPAPKRPDGQPGLWGYIACDGKLLYGSLANSQHKVRYAFVRSDMSELWGESQTLFALDPKSGDLRWRYDAEHSIRQNTIAMGSGRVFLIDRPVAEEDRWDPTDQSRKLPPVTKVNQAPGKIIAMEAATGKILWKSEGNAFGTMLAYSAKHDALLMGYQSTRFKLPSEIGGQLAVYRGSTGESLWEKKASYVTRPLINDQTVYAQGGAWDLLTGEDRPFTLQRSYGCGQLAGSKHMLLFRSATLGYMDLTRASGVENFGGIRPGCWINALPVGGLVLVPDASAGCQCSYQNRSWLALTGDE